MRTLERSLLSRLVEPVDGASLAAFRVLFGGLMLIATLRFWAKGWVEALYVAPSMHLTYWGFGWVAPLPEPGMTLVFAALAVASALVMIGLFYRAAIVAFFLLFTYVELIDQAVYLNHYYLVSLLALLMATMPLDRVASLDAWRRPEIAARGLPRWCVWTLRAQLGLVYFFAGVAKLQPDWLVDAQPLTGWLAARDDLPLLGPLLTLPGAAHAMSWGGALFDLSAPFALAHRATRPFAYAAVVGFHLVTGLLFQLGMFPWIMIGLTTIFFAPSWPRRWLGGPRRIDPGARTRRPRWLAPALAAWFAVQLALPIRHHAYDGDVLFTEEGMRFAWHVMIAEKAGRLELRAREGDREWLLDPSAELTLTQRRMMATSPDMILRYAHHVRDRYAREGRRVEVRAECWVALNGRPSRLLIDPDADLAAEPDGLGPRRWLRRAP